MSRRPHKKSRNGCLECKRRHIKCDENQPVCVNCGAAEMRCSFLGKNSPYIVPTLSHGHSHIAASGSVSTASSTPVSAPWPEHAMSNQEPSDPYSVNMTHIELFNNLFSKEILAFEPPGQMNIITFNIYKKYALDTPYLMHQTLTMSALHLSITTTKSPNFYREYATGLQNRALSLFNKNNPILEVSAANCVHMFLFASIVGVHLLCDILHYQRDSLEGFIDRFTHCLSVYRGLLAVLDQGRDLLHETELGPHLKMTGVLMEPKDVSGSECDALKDMIDAADVMPSSQEAYRESVFHLQRVFDGQRAASGDKTRSPVIFAWPTLVSPEYVHCLRQQRAEALVILAHYAVLLHHGRHLWLFGEGSRFLIESISSSPGSSWQEWLKFPKAALREDETSWQR